MAAFIALGMQLLIPTAKGPKDSLLTTAVLMQNRLVSTQPSHLPPHLPHLPHLLKIKAWNRWRCVAAVADIGVLGCSRG